LEERSTAKAKLWIAAQSDFFWNLLFAWFVQSRNSHSVAYSEGCKKPHPRSRDQKVWAKNVLVTGRFPTVETKMSVLLVHYSAKEIWRVQDPLSRCPAGVRDLWKRELDTGRFIRSARCKHRV